MTGIEIETRVLPLQDTPEGPGWNIWSGNERQNVWWRVVRTIAGQKEALVLHVEHWKEAN